MHKINPAHIGFDIDGVVADTGGAFIRIAAEEYGINSFTLDDITSFEVIDCLDVDQKLTKYSAGCLMTPYQPGCSPWKMPYPCCTGLPGSHL
jgi:uncharacterized HAD superfamily protein